MLAIKILRMFTTMIDLGTADILLANNQIASDGQLSVEFTLHRKSIRVDFIIFTSPMRTQKLREVELWLFFYL